MSDKKSDFLEALEILNKEALSQTKRTNPKNQSDSYNKAEAAFAKRDADILRKGIREAEARYDEANKLVWEIEHLDASKLPPSTISKAEALQARETAKKEKERLEKIAEELAQRLDALSARYTRYGNYEQKGIQYEFYLDKMLFPVAPGELTIKVKDMNDIIDLASGSELVLPQKPGLTKISFTALLPVEEYPWAQYKGGYQPPTYFLGVLEALKVSGKAVDFAVIRNHSSDPDGDTYMRVYVGEYSIREDASKLVNDIEVSIELVQANPAISHEVRLEKDGKASIVKNRPAGEGKPQVPCTHKVTLGETLSEISRYYYGDSKYWLHIAKANGREKNPHTLKGVEFLRIEAIADA